MKTSERTGNVWGGGGVIVPKKKKIEALKCQFQFSRVEYFCQRYEVELGYMMASSHLLLLKVFYKLQSKEINNSIYCNSFHSVIVEANLPRSTILYN